MRGERRLLFLAPYPPRRDALHGGARAMAGLIGGLAERHRVALLCLKEDDEEGIEPNLRERCEIAEEVSRRGAVASSLHARVRRRARSFRDALRLRPQWAASCDLDVFRRRVGEVDEAWRPDVVQAEYHVMGQYLYSVRGGPAQVLNQYEPGAHAARERWRSGGGGARGWVEARAWASFERSVSRRADVVVVLTARDREAMLPYAAGTRVEVIPLGVDIPPVPLDPAGRPPPSVLFVGNFQHPPNLDAARRLARSIFPRVRERFPEAVLHVVGEGAPEGLRAPGIVVQGRVPSVEPWLDRAAVVVAPLRSGGGMRVKVLEALAAGKAVVASPLAAEGLEGAPLLLAVGDEDTAAEIAALLQDRERRVRLGTQARAWAAAERGWEHTVDAFEALYEELLR